MTGLIRSLQNRLLRKELSCAELTGAYLAAISSRNGALNAYVTVTPDAALEAARRVDDKLAAGEALAPLEGIPMALKDNLSTRGIETTCCSNMLRGYVPIYDAAVWALLKARNAVLLGKTNMDEFAMGSSCETSCFGGAGNPYNTQYVAGGSSGGTAAAVAGGLAAYGLGSDTGGSVRQPAAFCGLTGLKPTYGAVSRYGLIAYASSFDQIGPMAVTAEDAALVYDAISLRDERDATSRGRSGPPTARGLDRDIRGMRIGVARQLLDGVRPEVGEALEKAAKTYEALGAKLVPFHLPALETALPVYYILACAEASTNLGRYDGVRYGCRAADGLNVDDGIRKARSRGFGREVQRRILLGTYVLSAGYVDAYYKKARSLREALIRAFEEAFRHCDVILAPTAPTTAFEKGFAVTDPVETYLTDICTVPASIAGLPAVSVPCGLDKKGLPVGMQLIGKAFGEADLLRAARQFERQTGGEYLCPLAVCPDGIGGEG